jgi:hypothetical protein
MTTKIGDIFEVWVDEDMSKYFQLIAFDMTQLNSDVVRVFKKKFSSKSSPVLIELVDSEIEFYAHCITGLGIDLGYWKLIGNVTSIGSTDILFRDTNDDYKNEISNDCWVWKVNGRSKNVGKLKGKNRKAEIGIVVNPNSLVHRIRTGDYNFVYPGFE